MKISEVFSNFFDVLFSVVCDVQLYGTFFTFYNCIWTRNSCTEYFGLDRSLKILEYFAQMLTA